MDVDILCVKAHGLPPLAAQLAPVLDGHSGRQHPEWNSVVVFFSPMTAQWRNAWRSVFDPGGVFLRR